MKFDLRETGNSHCNQKHGLLTTRPLQREKQTFKDYRMSFSTIPEKNKIGHTAIQMSLNHANSGISLNTRKDISRKITRNPPKPGQRNNTVDLTRTIAIFLMVIFHFIYDLKVFGYHNQDLNNGLGWEIFRSLILILFLLCVGISLVYVHDKRIQVKKFLTRLSQIALGSTMVSIISLAVVPDHWIYFGVLHFIVVASVITLPLVRRPYLALCLSITLLLGFNFGWLNPRWPFVYINEYLPRYTNDWVPLVPWLSVVWIGILLGHSRWLRKDPMSILALPPGWSWPGQHSLLIYLIHQPILYGILIVLDYFR